MKEHSFTPYIKDILNKVFKDNSEDIYEKSLLLQYLNLKTISANRGSKSRSSFANLYAIYVVVEDYINHGFHNNKEYSKYEGAQFSILFKRQRELPFGEKLQNHALNNRMNAEFQKFFPTSELTPIIRDLETNRYWINENLLLIRVGAKIYNIATSVIEIIDRYITIKQQSLKQFIEQCQQLQELSISDSCKIKSFIEGLLAPNVDARLFEIVSYAILKFFYIDQTIIWGYAMDSLKTEALHLYKTGRTNANDGGIDFVMKPLGRFFQVSETLDFRKYFLDIEKIERYPITFIIKTNDTVSSIRSGLRNNAVDTYKIEKVVDKYMNCIEEIINIPKLLACLSKVIERGDLSKILDEIILQSRVEFNYNGGE
jgi:hypothetical protein